MKYFVVAEARRPGEVTRQWYWVGKHDENCLASTSLFKATALNNDAEAQSIASGEMFDVLHGFIIRYSPHVVSMTDEEYFLKTLKR